MTLDSHDRKKPAELSRETFFGSNLEPFGFSRWTISALSLKWWCVCVWQANHLKCWGFFPRCVVFFGGGGSFRTKTEGMGEL